MQNSFVYFVRKEFLHVMRDPRTLLIVLLIPVVLLLLFGFAISTEVKELRVAVVAPVHSDEVREAVRRLEANPNFLFYGYIPSQEIEDVLQRGEVTAVVVFAAGTSVPAPKQIITDASNTNIATSAAVYLQNILQDTSPSGSLFEPRLLYNPQMKSAYNFVPGLMGLIFILVCAMMTSVSIVREKEVGTIEVLLVSPVRPLRIIIAKMIPYFTISCVTLMLILLMAFYVLDVPLNASLGGIICLSMFYIALALAFGLLISTFASTQVVALLVSAVVMMMPMMMLSGLLFPIDNLPRILQWLSAVVPARWYIAAIRKMMIEGLPFSAVWKEFAVLCGMLVAIGVLSLKKFNDRLE